MAVARNGTPQTVARAWIAAAIVGFVFGLLCFVILRAHHNANPVVTAGDFKRPLHDARDLLAGRDMYRHTPGPYAIPYPVPAALVAMPLAWLPDVVAGSVFMGLSVMLLAFGILRSGQEWRLAMLLSWSFVYALLWVQWTPLICALWYLPALAAMMLVKPNIALPVLLAGAFRPALFDMRAHRPLPERLRAGAWKWLVPPAVLLVASLIWYPAWPWVWRSQLGAYQGILPPLFSWPLGPLVLVALVEWRDRRAWLLVLLALMPQRMVYDQLPIMLVAGTRRELWVLIAASWVNCAIFMQSNGWSDVPLGWQNFLMATLYLPAVLMVAGPKLRTLASQALRGQELAAGER